MLTKKDMVKIIEDNNPAFNELSTWIRSEDDIADVTKLFNEDFESIYPDFTDDMAKRALETGKIMVYSSKPFSLGSFVTPSKMEAESYSGNGKIYSKKMNISDIAWIDEGQGQIIQL